MFTQASNVNDTGTQTHARADFISSPSISQLRKADEFDLWAVQYREYSIKYQVVP